MSQARVRAFDTWTSAKTSSHRALGQCPCCEHQERTIWFQNRDIVLHRCHQCGVVYQDPQPDLSALLKQSYGEEYFESCRQRLPNQTAAFSSRLADAEEILQASTRGQGPIRSLDVGSGIGAFLVAAKKRGWQAVGLEPSSYAVRFCTETLGLNVLEGTLDDHPPFSHQFDIIHLHHVLEHFQRPLKNLQHLKTLLRPGGLLMVEVPREGKLASTLLHKLSSWRGAARYPRPVYTIVHMCTYTPTSLRLLLERAGFEIERLWIEANAASPERYQERFGDSPPLGKLFGRASLLFHADVWVGLGNTVAYARSPTP